MMFISCHQTIPFSDTLIIEKLTQDQLVLKQGELIRNFTKLADKENGESIPAATLTPAKKIVKAKGKLIIGHESRSFTATGDTHSYWVKDDTNTLIQEYDKVTQGTKNGTCRTGSSRFREIGRGFCRQLQRCLSGNKDHFSDCRIIYKEYNHPLISIPAKRFYFLIPNSFMIKGTV